MRLTSEYSSKPQLPPRLSPEWFAATLRGFQPEVELSDAFRLRLRTELAALSAKTPLLAA